MEVFLHEVLFYTQPFWRLWNAAGSDGRGVIGIVYGFEFPHLKSYIKLSFLLRHFILAGLLEANFVEPAHDKQGFERTTVLSRLEGKLLTMQKNYWFVL